MLLGCCESRAWPRPIKASPIAKKSRIHADRPPHPCGGRFALRAGLYGASSMIAADVRDGINILSRRRYLHERQAVTAQCIAFLTGNKKPRTSRGFVDALQLKLKRFPDELLVQLPGEWRYGHPQNHDRQSRTVGEPSRYDEPFPVPMRVPVL